MAARRYVRTWPMRARAAGLPRRRLAAARGVRRRRRRRRRRPTPTATTTTSTTTIGTDDDRCPTDDPLRRLRAGADRVGGLRRRRPSAARSRCRSTGPTRPGRRSSSPSRRTPAGDPDERIGILATNPGGPGASGVEFVRRRRRLRRHRDRRAVRHRVAGTPAASADRRRSTATTTSTRASSASTATPTTPPSRPPSTTPPPTFAAGCGDEHGDLLPHVGTDDVACDLEAIRRSLGEPMAYVGFSYGTFIGLRYAELFPQGAEVDRARRRRRPRRTR